MGGCGRGVVAAESEELLVIISLINFSKSNIHINCFAGVGNKIAVFVRNKAFPRCGETFFVNDSCEFDKHARKKTLPLNNMLLTPKT